MIPKISKYDSVAQGIKLNNHKLLEKTIGHHFKDAKLLERALTHCSAGANNNERYEFLGDSVLNLILSQALYEQFPTATEGQLTRLRAICVNGEALAKISREFNLGEQLSFGVGELRSGGATRPSILADALEALIAAIYLDAGFDVTKACVLNWYQPLLTGTSLEMTKKDPKTQLQEWLQGRHQPLPEYTVVAIQGESHEQSFNVECRIVMCDQLFTGTGTSRRRAEQSAARAALEYLNHEHPE